MSSVIRTPPYVWGLRWPYTYLAAKSAPSSRTPVLSLGVAGFSVLLSCSSVEGERSAAMRAPFVEEKLRAAGITRKVMPPADYLGIEKEAG
jgi:hypothetical protein